MFHGSQCGIDFSDKEEQQKSNKEQSNQKEFKSSGYSKAEFLNQSDLVDSHQSIMEDITNWNTSTRSTKDSTHSSIHNGIETKTNHLGLEVGKSMDNSLENMEVISNQLQCNGKNQVNTCEDNQIPLLPDKFPEGANSNQQIGNISGKLDSDSKVKEEEDFKFIDNLMNTRYEEIEEKITPLLNGQKNVQQCTNKSTNRQVEITSRFSTNFANNCNSRYSNQCTNRQMEITNNFPNNYTPANASTFSTPPRHQMYPTIQPDYQIQVQNHVQPCYKSPLNRNTKRRSVGKVFNGFSQQKVYEEKNQIEVLPEYGFASDYYGRNKRLISKVRLGMYRDVISPYNYFYEEKSINAANQVPALHLYIGKQVGPIMPKLLTEDVIDRIKNMVKGDPKAVQKAERQMCVKGFQQAFSFCANQNGRKLLYEQKLFFVFKVFNRVLKVEVNRGEDYQSFTLMSPDDVVILRTNKLESKDFGGKGILVKNSKQEGRRVTKEDVLLFCKNVKNHNFNKSGIVNVQVEIKFVRERLQCDSSNCKITYYPYHFYDSSYHSYNKKIDVIILIECGNTGITRALFTKRIGNRVLIKHYHALISPKHSSSVTNSIFNSSSLALFSGYPIYTH